MKNNLLENHPWEFYKQASCFSLSPPTLLDLLQSSSAGGANIDTERRQDADLANDRGRQKLWRFRVKEKDSGGRIFSEAEKSRKHGVE